MKNFNNKTIFHILTAVFVIILFGIAVLVTAVPISIKTNSNKITVSGGDIFSNSSMQISDVKDVYIKDTIPGCSKIVGVAIGSIRKGTFNVDGLGKGHVYTESDKGPFLYIIGNNNFIIYESKDSAKVNKVYQDVLQKTGINKK